MANFNQTWHKAFKSVQRRATSFSKGDYNEITKIHWRNLKIVCSRTTGPILTKLGAMYLCVKGIQVFINNQPFNSQKCCFVQMCLLIGTVSQLSVLAHGPLVYASSRSKIWISSTWAFFKSIKHFRLPLLPDFFFNSWNGYTVGYILSYTG